MWVDVIKGDITTLNVDAIVNPANSYGLMGGGVALAIRKKGGKVIEEEAMRKVPIPIGTSVSTAAGKLPCKFVIHSPTMKEPVERTSIENVQKATISALVCASKLEVKSMAFPGMGTGVGGININDAARCMVSAIVEFNNNPECKLESVLLVGYNDELTNAFKEWIKKLSPGTEYE